MSQAQNFYQEQIAIHQPNLDAILRQYNWFSWARGIVFVLGCILGYYCFQFHVGMGLAVSAICLGLFIWLIAKHSQIAEKREHVLKLKAIHDAELKALDHDVSNLADGKQYIDPDHDYSYDLDLFGPGSIFQFLNRTGTILGQRSFVSWLCAPFQSVSEIQQRQEAVSEIGSKASWNLNFQAIGHGLNENGKEREELIAWGEEDLFFTEHKYYPLLMKILPTLFIGTMLAWIIPDIPGLRNILAPFQLSGWVSLGFFLLNLAVIRQHLKTTARHQLQVGKKSLILRRYGKLIAEIEQEHFESAFLQKQKEALKTDGKKASEAITELGDLAYQLDQRLNALMGFILNGAILWDIRCLMKLEKWRKNYRHQLSVWLDVLAEWDALISLGRYRFNYPAYCMPEVSEGPFHLEAKDLGHPLISETVRINNDMDLGKPGEFLIVTGANMAGKSTFLRTVGVNLILAMCGGPVCASNYRFSPLPLITSIRNHDSLQDNESYFYAELKQLKRIIDMVQTQPAFVIVDEMLRGTNSRDKQTGSRKFIEQLIHLKAVGMIATHDLSLGSLAEEYPDFARNKRFEVEISQDQLIFDYKLQDGISQNLNATFLMQKMGIMP